MRYEFFCDCWSPGRRSGSFCSFYMQFFSETATSDMEFKETFCVCVEYVVHGNIILSCSCWQKLSGLSGFCWQSIIIITKLLTY